MNGMKMFDNKMSTEILITGLEYQWVKRYDIRSWGGWEKLV